MGIVFEEVNVFVLEGVALPTPGTMASNIGHRRRVKKNNRKNGNMGLSDGDNKAHGRGIKFGLTVLVALAFFAAAWKGVACVVDVQRCIATDTKWRTNQEQDALELELELELLLARASFHKRYPNDTSRKDRVRFMVLFHDQPYVILLKKHGICVNAAITKVDLSYATGFTRVLRYYNKDQQKYKKKNR